MADIITQARFHFRSTSPLYVTRVSTWNSYELLTNIVEYPQQKKREMKTCTGELFTYVRYQSVGVAYPHDGLKHAQHGYLGGLCSFL